MKYSCPFCGSECKKYRNLAAKAMVGRALVMYHCNNRSCGATISFNNRDCNLDPNMTDRWFFRRYLGGDSDAK